jgi:hypothetical protein
MDENTLGNWFTKRYETGDTRGWDQGGGGAKKNVREEVEGTQPKGYTKKGATLASALLHTNGTNMAGALHGTVAQVVHMYPKGRQHVWHPAVYIARQPCWRAIWVQIKNVSPTIYLWKGK